MQPGIRFEWHPGKARTNLAKHGVSFDEASTAFLDEYARVIADSVHSLDETRYVLLGMSRRGRLLVVVHTCRQGDEVIRLISARKATRQESRAYQAWIGE